MTGALIVTALLDADSQARFDAERRRYFPAERNFLSAHVTLFHALPGGETDSVAQTLREVCGAQAAAAFATRGLQFLGRGVAYALDMPEVIAVRARLAGVWADWLTPQDRQGFRPHVTVQNKVAPEAARALLGELEARYSPWRGEVVGLGLWRYEGGPWAPVRKMRFRRGDTGGEPT